MEEALKYFSYFEKPPRTKKLTFQKSLKAASAMQLLFLIII